MRLWGKDSCLRMKKWIYPRHQICGHLDHGILMCICSFFLFSLSLRKLLMFSLLCSLPKRSSSSLRIIDSWIVLLQPVLSVFTRIISNSHSLIAFLFQLHLSCYLQLPIYSFSISIDNQLDFISICLLSSTNFLFIPLGSFITFFIFCFIEFTFYKSI